MSAQVALGLSRLLLVARPLWLLDEPSVSLDAASITQLETIIRQHLEAGGMAIIATHQPIDVPGAEFLDLGGEAST